ncbi:hypothetical protein MSIBF_A1420022 [groundwater metagenome]|uniref:Uncharacterized protein n=1 Tax=groundwater metagenome TaxID=717931 RepID=A0A098E7C8_9ZZZZ
MLEPYKRRIIDPTAEAVECLSRAKNSLKRTAEKYGIFSFTGRKAIRQHGSFAK